MLITIFLKLFKLPSSRLAA